MISNIKICLVLLALVSSSICLTFPREEITDSNGDPVPTDWKSQWEASFTEFLSLPVLGTGTTTGKFVYDYTNERFFISRGNGKLEHFCGSIYVNQNTPCNQIVREGKRYFIFPEKQFCCMCCNSDRLG